MGGELLCVSTDITHPNAAELHSGAKQGDKGKKSPQLKLMLLSMGMGHCWRIPANYRAGRLT